MPKFGAGHGALELGTLQHGGEEPVLESRVLVENAAHGVHFFQHLVRLPRKALEVRAAGLRIHSSRNDAVHHEAMAERLVVRAQPILLEAHELREGKAEAAVVAERSEIAQVIGDALALEH